MADENKGVALAVLGIVAVLAIVGLVLLFTGAKQATGDVSVYGGYQGDFGRFVADPTLQYCTEADSLRGLCIPGSAKRSGVGPAMQTIAGGEQFGYYTPGIRVQQ
jgi:hypothetical protein